MRSPEWYWSQLGKQCDFCSTRCSTSSCLYFSSIFFFCSRSNSSRQIKFQISIAQAYRLFNFILRHYTFSSTWLLCLYTFDCQLRSPPQRAPCWTLELLAYSTFHHFIIKNNNHDKREREWKKLAIEGERFVGVVEGGCLLLLSQCVCIEALISRLEMFAYRCTGESLAWSLLLSKKKRHNKRKWEEKTNTSWPH